MARLIRAPICRAANKHASLPLHAPRALKRLKPLTQPASPARIRRRTGSRSKVFDLDQTARLPSCVCRVRCLGGSKCTTQSSECERQPMGNAMSAERRMRFRKLREHAWEKRLCGTNQVQGTQESLPRSSRLCREGLQAWAVGFGTALQQSQYIR